METPVASDTLPLTSKNEETKPSMPILSWNDISYDVSVKDGVRRILHNVSGSIYPGEVVAIMGASGAGKTTLLNVLSGRIQGGKLFGDVKFNGAKRDPHTFKRMLAYVEQEDLMHDTLTVEETLAVSARLRLSSKKYTDKEKLQRVDKVMRQLRLSHIANSRIGGASKRGISGGERKRVSIGIELVTDPSILVLDEPSSGLDSSSAEMVVKLTKDMAHERNLCTLMTIHQPSAEMVAQFDKLILLSQGKLVYMGPADQALQYFEKLGYPTTNPNPANFYIDLTTIDFTSSTATKESETRVQSLVDCYAEFSRNGSKLLVDKSSSAESETTGNFNNISAAAGTDYSGEMREHKSSSPEILPSSEQNGSSYFGSHSGVDKDITNEAASIALYQATPRNSWISEVFVLLKRDWLLSVRDVTLMYGFVFQCIMMIVFLGFVFFQMKNDQASVQNRTGMLFMLVIQSSIPVTFPTMTSIILGHHVLMRERSTSTFRMSSYIFAKALSVYPLAFPSLIIMFVGVYFIAHLQYDAAKFFIALAVLIVIIYASLGLAFAFSMLFTDMETAFVVTPVVTFTLFLFAGNMSNAGRVTPVLRWIKYICIYYYAYSGFMQNEFGGLKLECENDLTACYHTGEEVLAANGLGELPIWLTIIINFCIGTALYAIGYAALRWMAKPRYIWI
ncbi:hypothetical protein GGH99_000559 [Coemansia sp. RSA 1285]|nr:hypothetical protein GGH99_000559 [Coemansia sp. RSA 1285]